MFFLCSSDIFYLTLTDLSGSLLSVRVDVVDQGHLFLLVFYFILFLLFLFFFFLGNCKIVLKG